MPHREGAQALRDMLRLFVAATTTCSAARSKAWSARASNR
jgi:hypothetical protein